MKKFLRFLFVVIFLAIFAAAGMIGMKFYEKYSEGDERADLYDYYELTDAGQGAIVFDDVILEETCKVLNQVCYLDISVVQKYLHKRFYYSDYNREIRYTDADMIVIAPLDGGSYSTFSPEEEAFYEEAYTIALVMDDTCYIALDFIEKFVPVSHTIYSDPNRVVINTQGIGRTQVEVSKDTVVRWRAGVKSAILSDVKAGEKVFLLDKTGVEDWTKVATADGFIGYIRNSRLGAESYAMNPMTLEYREPEYNATLSDDKIRLGFHAVYNMTANEELEDVLETAFNINVIAPTWFSLSDDEGNFVSIASKKYVQKAHEKGVQVWALIEDITYRDVDMYKVFADSTSRMNLITNLMEAVSDYELDGINIDFEYISAVQGPHFVQFLRELSIYCRQNGVVLSVDNYPPNSGNAYYDYREQGIVADYVILMGYDEHWTGSGDPGSTASQPFVERSIDHILNRVPANKVINALPFYTRLWKKSGDTITDQAVSIKNIEKNVNTLGMKIDFDNEAGMKYASVEKDGAFYQMWIEDYASIENKLITMKKANLAGAAAWRLGYETQEIWELIGSYMP